MNKQIEALKMAIKILSQDEGWFDPSEAIKACKEALAEAEKREPVAWNEEEFNAIAYAYRSCPSHEIKMISERYKDLVDYVLSITHPTTWHSLSDDEMKIIQDNSWIIHADGSKEFNTFVFARAIESKLKEKNHA